MRARAGRVWQLPQQLLCCWQCECVRSNSHHSRTLPAWCSPKSSDRTAKNAYGCGAVIQYKVCGVRGCPPAPGFAAGSSSASPFAHCPHHPSRLTHHPPHRPRPPLPPQFPNWTKLAAYQACEHALPKYIAQLQPYKIPLPTGTLRDFKC